MMAEWMRDGLNLLALGRDVAWVWSHFCNNGELVGMEKIRIWETREKGVMEISVLLENGKIITLPLVKWDDAIAFSLDEFSSKITRPFLASLACPPTG